MLFTQMRLAKASLKLKGHIITEIVTTRNPVLIEGYLFVVKQNNQCAFLVRAQELYAALYKTPITKLTEKYPDLFDVPFRNLDDQRAMWYMSGNSQFLTAIKIDKSKPPF